MKLVWTRAAMGDRKAIREYIAADDPRAALDFDAMISKKAEGLLDHPSMGRPGRVHGTRELVAHRNYILIYDIGAGLVRVLRVLHAARMWPPATNKH